MATWKHHWDEAERHAAVADQLLRDVDEDVDLSPEEDAICATAAVGHGLLALWHDGRAETIRRNR